MTKRSLNFQRHTCVSGVPSCLGSKLGESGSYTSTPQKLSEFSGIRKNLTLADPLGDAPLHLVTDSFRDGKHGFVLTASCP